MTAVTQSVANGQSIAGAGQADAKPVSRTWAALAFGVSSLVTAGLSVGGGWISHHYEQQQDQRKDDFKSFSELADKLDPLFREFVQIYLATAPVDAEGKPRKAAPLDDTKIRKQVELIQINIQQQDAVLERLEIAVLGRDIGIVKDYRRKDIELSALLDRLPPVEDGAALMQAMERARSARWTVLQALQKRAAVLFYSPPAQSTESAGEN